MAKQDVYSLELDKYEYGVTINALNGMRNDLIEENRPTDAVDDLLVKAIETKPKKGRLRNEAR